MICDKHLSEAASLRGPKAIYMGSLLAFTPSAALHRDGAKKNVVLQDANFALTGCLYQVIQSYMAVTFVTVSQSHEESLVQAQRIIDDIFTPERLAKLKQTAEET